MEPAQRASAATLDIAEAAGAASAVNRALARYIAEAAALADTLTDHNESDLAMALLAHCSVGVTIMERLIGLLAPPDSIDQLMHAALEATRNASEGAPTNG